MEKEFHEAMRRVDRAIDRGYAEYKREEIIKECEELGIFPMFTEGALCMELNRLGSVIRHNDKFGELDRIKRKYGV